MFDLLVVKFIKNFPGYRKFIFLIKNKDRLEPKS